MITIHKHKVLALTTYARLHQMAVYLKLIHPDLKVINDSFEYGHKYRQLHLHLIVKNPYSINYKDLSTREGFKFHYDRLYSKADLHCSQIYIAKDQYDLYKIKA